jgi:hypothetical protein
MNIHDVYRPFQIYFRRSRMRKFVNLFQITNNTRIIDVGGNTFNWGLIDLTPDVTLVNIFGEAWDRPSMRMVVYDGHKLPFGDYVFDVSYSNSVIEHVGPKDKVQNFAREVRRMAHAYYVETPNRQFFVEPHFICVFIHWLPFGVKRKLIRYFSIWGLITKPSQEQVDRVLQDIRLLTVRQMRELFPDATIFRERFLGMTKSIIAVRTEGMA